MELQAAPEVDGNGIFIPDAPKRHDRSPNAEGRRALGTLGTSKKTGDLRIATLPQRIATHGTPVATPGSTIGIRGQAIGIRGAAIEMRGQEMEMRRAAIGTRGHAIESPPGC
jgi:hypothetical protein